MIKSFEEQYISDIMLSIYVFDADDLFNLCKIIKMSILYSEQLKKVP